MSTIHNMCHVSLGLGLKRIAHVASCFDSDSVVLRHILLSKTKHALSEVYGRIFFQLAVYISKLPSLLGTGWSQGRIKYRQNQIKTSSLKTNSMPLHHLC